MASSTDTECVKTCQWGKGKVALVTGAARRVGRAIASTLHKHGYNIVIHYNTSRDSAVAFADQLNSERKDSAHLISANLSTNVVETCQRIVRESVEKWDRLDVLVNSAAQYFLTPLSTTSDDDWNRLMDTNVKAPYFLTQAASHYLKKTRGSVVNLADIIGERPSHLLTVYSISKAAIIMSTKNLAIELGPEVRVNYVCPGAAMWPEVDMEHHDNTFRQEWLSRTPLSRVGTGEDVADAVAFLVSPSAAYITGSGINVCGGRSLKL